MKTDPRPSETHSLEDQAPSPGTAAPPPLGTRAVVVAALQKTMGLMNNPAVAPLVLAGKDIDLSQIDLDSLDLFEVIMEIEDRLGLQLDADDVAGQPTLHALVVYLDSLRT